MKKYVCLICGYVHEGDEPPAVCPVCGAAADKFKDCLLYTSRCV